MHTLWTIIAGIFKMELAYTEFCASACRQCPFIIILLLAVWTMHCSSEQDTQTSREPEHYM